MRAVKGPNRPHQTEAVRAARLASLPAVDLVIVDTAYAADEIIRMLRPHVVVKTSNEARDAAAAVMQEWNGAVILAEMLPEIAAD